jgi:hypothetical protein
MHTCKAFLPQSVQQTLGSLNVSNTPECVGSVCAQTCSMPSWQSLTECLVTLRYTSSYAEFLSKVFNNLEILS